MSYRVSDFFHTYRDGVKLIAGKGGLERVVTDAGILDYEMIPSLKNKYFHTNFQEGQFVLTSFLYAKDNPFLLSDAIKHLVNKGASGLAIKDVFHLSIHESVIRYADSRNFPVFLIESPKVYIEKIIYDVKRHVNLAEQLIVQQQEIGRILSPEGSRAEVRQAARELNPSFEEQYFSAYLKMGANFREEDFSRVHSAFMESELGRARNLITYYKHGVLVTCSDDNLKPEDVDGLAAEIAALCRAAAPAGEPAGTEDGGMRAVHKAVAVRTAESDDIAKAGVVIGVSDLHLTLEEYRESLYECIYSTCFEEILPGAAEGAGAKEAAQTEEDGRMPAGSMIYYRNLGTYKMLITAFSDRQMVRFSDGVLNPVLDYDAENSTQLFVTLGNFIDCDCNIEKTSLAMGQHKNTIRYRMDRITEITGLDYKKYGQLEELSLAVKIRRCNEMLVF